MDRLNIGRISSKKMDMLQDLSVDFSQLVKKYIKNLKKLSSKDQRAFGKLFGDFKDGLDDMSTNESVNESVNLNEGTRSQVGIIDKGGKIQSAYVHFDGYPSNMKQGIKKHIKNEKDEALEFRGDDFKDYFMIDTELIKFNYQIDIPVDSVKSVSLKKSDEINGKLIGFKGQYLIFDNSSVFNVRSNEGFLIDLTID